MKDSVLDVLVYLFEHEYHDDTPPEALLGELTDSGFPQKDLDDALRWLEELREAGARPELDSPGLRIYAEAEMAHLSTECRGFLLYLEQLGILSAGDRELVVERTLALTGGDPQAMPLTQEQLQWIVLMVLFSRPGADGNDIAMAWMEDYIYNGGERCFH